MSVALARMSFRSRRSCKLRGFSLLELLIAMAIGLAITGAALSILPATTSAAREQHVQAALAEDAHSALALMAIHLRMAGYRKNPGVLQPGVRGCDQRLVVPSTLKGAPLIADLTCPSTATKATSASSEIATQFEADAFNTEPVKGRPSDCIGNEIFPNSSGDSISTSRFYISVSGTTKNPALYCDGSGGTPGSTVFAQAILDNVERMRVSFSTDSPTLKTAAEIDAIPGAFDDKWKLVQSVDICLLLRSDAGFSSKPAPYVDCEGKIVTPPAGDSRLRHAFSQTVQLRNHVVVTVLPTTSSTPVADPAGALPIPSRTSSGPKS